MPEPQTGQDKIQSICKVLREETLQPAKQEAAEVLEKARAEAEGIIADAKKEAKRLLDEARERIKREASVFESALSQAGKQGVESLRQEIEKGFFNEELSSMLSEGGKDPQLVSRLIEAIVTAVEKEGISADLEALIPQSVSSEEVNRHLGERVLQRLKGQSVQVAGFDGGAQVKLLDKKMTIDMTRKALEELLSNYVRKDFRKYLFQ